MAHDNNLFVTATRFRRELKKFPILTFEELTALCHRYRIAEVMQRAVCIKDQKTLKLLAQIAEEIEDNLHPSQPDFDGGVEEEKEEQQEEYGIPHSLLEVVTAIKPASTRVYNLMASAI